jgi:hypothetical protein
MRTALLWTVLCAAAGSLPAADFFPLQQGNEWLYEESATGARFQIRVGSPVLILGNVYHQLHGYTERPLLVRRGDNGALYARDEENDRDVLLASFEPLEGGWFEAPYRPCEQSGQVQDRRTVYEGPAGRFASALHVRYRSLGCADAGIEEELYAENVGMLARISTSIAGPRAAHLVYARIGALLLAAQDGTSVDLGLSPAAGPEPKLRLDFRITVRGATPLLLTFPSFQEYEMVLKDAAGVIRWRWSDGRVFPQALRTVEFGPGLRLISEEAPLPAEPGFYTVEAWMTAGDDGRRGVLAAAARFEVARSEAGLLVLPARGR